jgi:hypothetical protein
MVATANRLPRRKPCLGRGCAILKVFPSCSRRCHRVLLEQSLMPSLSSAASRESRSPRRSYALSHGLAWEISDANLVETPIKIAFAAASVAREEPAQGPATGCCSFVRVLSFPMRIKIQRETCDD